MIKSIYRLALLSMILASISVRDLAGAPEARSAAQATSSGPAIPLKLDGVENVFRIGHKIISGACPFGEAGFRALAQAGVKTIITVDGARPDEAKARKFGMRYVHIPVPYSGISRAQSLAIARAVRDLPGPVFIHCHHGKHRSPTAAVLAAMMIDGWTIEQAQSAMRQAGTGKTYGGLWAAVRDYKPVAQADLDSVDNSFPASVALPALPVAMVAIDEKWDALGATRKAGWKAPAAHPDLDPAHEALMLREDFAELARSPETIAHPKDFQEKMTASQTAVAALEAALRAGNKTEAESSYSLVDASCKSCHAVYRDRESTQTE